jgi:hypothetical protein
MMLSGRLLLWTVLAAGVVWHLLIIAYVYRWSPTLSVPLDEADRHP